MATEQSGTKQRMESLTESAIAEIARQQRDAGVQRLSCHFSWPEFCDERRRFHQEFVYDVAMFAASRGVPWPEVIRAAVIARGVFPQLDDVDVPKLLSLLRDALYECLPNLTSVQQQDFTQFLTDSCLTRRRLFQAVVGGAGDITITQLHLEVEVPPTPCPLVEGTDGEEWERQHREAHLLRQKEEELQILREGSRVTLGAVDIPEGGQLDKEGILALVGAAVKATESQILESLNQEASLIGDILQLRLQLAASATRGLHNPAVSDTEKVKQHTP